MQHPGLLVVLLCFNAQITISLCCNFFLALDFSDFYGKSVGKFCCIILDSVGCN